METGGQVVDLQRRHNAAQSDDERRLILREDKMVSRSYQVQEALSRLRTPERYDAFVAFLKAQDEASWWIDWNQASLASIIERHAEQLDKVERTAKPVAAEIKEIAREEMAEAVLKPAGEPVAATIAEIRRAGDAIEVKFPEKRDDFRKTIKAMGYLWENCWRKKLSDKTGDPSDGQYRR